MEIKSTTKTTVHITEEQGTIRVYILKGFSLEKLPYELSHFVQRRFEIPNFRIWDLINIFITPLADLPRLMREKGVDVELSELGLTPRDLIGNRPAEELIQEEEELRHKAVGRLGEQAVSIPKTTALHDLELMTNHEYSSANSSATTLAKTTIRRKTGRAV